MCNVGKWQMATKALKHPFVRLFWNSTNFHRTLNALGQGLLKLLWTVYSEGKLQSRLKLRNFRNPFNKDKSVVRHTMHKKGVKFALVVELTKLNFTYITLLK